MPDAQLPTFEFSIGDYFDNNDEELLNACISAEVQLSETKETENSENKRSAEVESETITKWQPKQQQNSMNRLI